MISHRIPFSALVAAMLMLAALPFTGCRSVANKSSVAEAERLINEASAARDYDRINTLADSLGKAGKLSKGESNYWQGYAHYQMGQRELAEYFWQEAIRVTEKSDDPNDLGGKFIMPGVIDSHVHVTIGVYSLCIWIQCVVYIHRKKWLNKTI